MYPKITIMFLASLWLLPSCHVALSIPDEVIIIPESCGDGVMDPGETCDGTELLGATCETFGFDGGTLSCDQTCNVDTSACFNAGVCGDGEINLDEQCDGENLGGSSCISLGFDAGVLACDACAFDTSGCEGGQGCGDGEVGTDEECDGASLGGSTCETLGYYGGTLSCSGECVYDLTDCESHGRCGDGVSQSDYGEACDGDDLGGSSCESLGQRPGTLSCSDSCALDDTLCGGSCGDGVIQAEYEECDGSAIPSCYEATQLRFGSVSCSGTCNTTATCTSVIMYGSGMADSGYKLRLDSQGNIYVVGYTSGEIEGQPGVGSTDFFITKLSPEGVRLWTRVHGSTEMDYGRDVAVDSADNIYVAASVGGAVNGISGFGGNDILLLKMDPDGNTLWTKIYGTSGNDTAGGVFVDGSDNIYLAGTTEGALNGQIHRGGGDAVVLKLNSAGTLQWTTQFGTAGADYGNDVVVDSTGQIHVVGNTSGTLNGTAGLGGTDIFLVKLTAAGAIVTTSLLGGTGDDSAMSLYLDNTTGAVYIAGSTYGTVGGETSAGYGDALFLKADQSGNMIWSILLGSTGFDFAYDITQASDGIYGIGSTTGALGGVTADSFDPFVVKLSPNGSPSTIFHEAVPGLDFLMGAIPDPNGGVLVTGGVNAGFMGSTGDANSNIVIFHYQAP